MNQSEMDLSTLLQSLTADLQALQANYDTTTTRDTTRRFMRNIYQLGLRVERDPALRATPEVATFLQESARFLSFAVVKIESFVRRFTQRIYDMNDRDWRQACEERSSIAFLDDLYQDTVFGGLLDVDEVDFEELDRVMREQGYRNGYIAPGTVPEGIPDTHWWWRPEKLPPPPQGW